jgi:hypothetical protein
MRPEDIAQKLLDLFSAPVPGSADLPAAHPQFWPEFLFDLSDGVFDQFRRSAPRKWARQVGRLLDLLEEAAPETRARVIMRLQRLREYGCLSAGEIRRFARIVWGHREPSTALPFFPGLRSSWVLILPEPREGMAVDKLQQYLRGADLLKLRSRTVDTDGRQRWNYTGYADPDAYLHDWLLATPNCRAQVDQPRRRYLETSRTDVVALAGKLRSWWEEEGREVLPRPGESTQLPIMVLEPFRRRVVAILNVIRDVAVPRIKRGTRIASDMLDLVEDFASRNLPTSSVLPALLKYRPDKLADTAASITRALASRDENSYRSAVQGIIFWLTSQRTGNQRPLGYRLPPPPSRLLHQLSDNFAYRRQPGLLTTIQAVSTILQHDAARVDAEFLDSVTIGLDYLMEEAAYRAKDNTESLIRYPDVPEYRRWIVHVARLLTAVVPGPRPAVQRWLEEATRDPLPEVRRIISDSLEHGEEDN